VKTSDTPETFRAIINTSDTAGTVDSTLLPSVFAPIEVDSGQGAQEPNNDVSPEVRVAQHAHAVQVGTAWGQSQDLNTKRGLA
jgi:hypothetical protein